MRKRLLLFILFFLTSCRTLDPLRSANSVISHNLCSYVFVSGLEPDPTFATFLAPRPGIRWIRPLIRYRVDREKHTVETTFAGLLSRTALYRGAEGCLVYQDDSSFKDSAMPNPLPAPAEDPTPVSTNNKRLSEALEKAFQEDMDYPRQTHAVVIMQHGSILAEKYAPGIGVNTPLLGYSLTKSVTAALVGLLVNRGDLSLAGPLSFWQDQTDPRRDITVEHILRMTSGLSIEDNGSGSDPATRAVYLEADSAAYVASQPLKNQPGTHWEYSSASTLLASALIRDSIKRHGEDVASFAQRELFQPLGMYHVTLEFDSVGTPLGAAYMLASARDWARFGQLYVNHGRVGHQQLLSEAWIEKTMQPTLGQGYGLGFWLNKGDDPSVQERIGWGMPPGSYYAYGILGQYVIIIPEEELVIVRLGATHNWAGINGFDTPGVARLTKDVLDALREKKR